MENFEIFQKLKSWNFIKNQILNPKKHQNEILNPKTNPFDFRRWTLIWES